MNEMFDQKISQFLDGSLKHDEALSLLQEMRLKPELVDKFNRYQAISHALKHGIFLDVSSDLSDRISQQIEAEPTVFKPLAKRSFFATYQKPFALAASIAVIAVLVHEGNPNTTPTTLKKLLPAQMASQTATRQTNNPVTLSQTARKQPLNIRIYRYLQAHNSILYGPEYGELKPIARSASYN